MRAYVNGKYVDKEDIQVDDTYSKQMQLETLKEELATYDYIGVKIAMGVATREEYKDKIEYTESLRIKIRELENDLEEKYNE